MMIFSFAHSKTQHFYLIFIVFFFSCFFISCAQKDPLTASDEATHIQKANAIVSAAHPIAAKAGSSILSQGGSSIDAAITTQMVLNLVEPQSSGIGGGGFLVHYSSSRKKIETFDGRETAPSSATPNMFLTQNGSPKNFFEAAVSGSSVGIPGLLRMLEIAHKKHGKLPWKKLFAPAISIARNGFRVSERLSESVSKDRYLELIPKTSSYFRPNKQPVQVGDILKNEAFALVLEEIASGGADAFYSGKTAAAISAATKNAPTTKAEITLEDLSNYKAKKRKPICSPYRIWLICGMGPPSSGGIAVAQILGILENFDLAGLKPFSAEAVHLIAEASRLAFADRSAYLADPDFVKVPIDRLIDRSYLENRAKKLLPNNVMQTTPPGNFSIIDTSEFSPDETKEGSSTTHISTADRQGNIVSMTSSIESRFGSRLSARGFLLNNQLTDFSFFATRNGKPVANSVQAKKRPRSSMSPTLVFGPDGQFLLSIGSPGGSRIISYVVKTLIAILDWRMPLGDAINAPNFANVNGITDIEKSSTLEKLVPALKLLGHKVKTRPLVSGLHGIMQTNAGLIGAADKRREGIAVSQ